MKKYRKVATINPQMKFFEKNTKFVKLFGKQIHHFR